MIRSLYRDRTGVAALEFALVASVFLFLFFGIIDVGRYGLTLHSLNTLASEAARSIIINCNGPLKPSCATITLSEAQQQHAAPFAFVGGTPSLTASASAGAITVTATLGSPFRSLLPITSTLDGTLSQSTLLNY